MEDHARFLEAIYAAPDDDGPRAVYADWLSERGDPRGEFITLQLGPRATTAARKREATLLKKHGDEWAGPLRTFLSKPTRVFERGFLARGAIRPDLDAVDVDAPEWATLVGLDVANVLDDAFRAFAAAAWFARLRALHGITVPKLGLLAKRGPSARLEELTFYPAEEPDAKARNFQELFPKLRHLRVGATCEQLSRLLEKPLPASLERLTLDHSELPLANLVAVAERRRLDVPVLECAPPGDPSESYEVRRDARGRYTRLRARPRHANSLEEQLRHLTTITALVVETKHAWPIDDTTRIEARIAERKELGKVDVPWPRPGSNASPFLELRFALHYEDDGRGIAARAGAVIDLVMAPPLSLTFDTQRTATGHEALEGEPRAAAKKLVAKPRFWQLELYLAGNPQGMRLSLDRDYLTIRAPRVPPRELAAWIARLIDKVDLGAFSAPFLARDGAGELTTTDGPILRPLDLPSAWIRGFGPNDERFFDFDELRAAVAALPWMHAYRTRRHVFFVSGDDPERRPTTEEHQGLALVLGEAFWNHFERRHRFRPVPLVRELLVLRGWTRSDVSAAGDAVFHHEVPGHRTVSFRIHLDPASESLIFNLESDVVPEIRTRAEAEDALRRLVSRFRG